MAIKAVAADIDRVEAEAEAAPEPGEDWIMLPLPMEAYKAISDAAAKKNMTVAQLFARAIAIAVEEE